MVSAAVVGNVTLVVLLGSYGVYGVLTLGFFNGWWRLAWFGENWARDGFCLSFKGTWYHSHLLCFYGDVVMATVMAVAMRGTKRSELVDVGKSAASVAMHGVGHLVLWATPIGAPTATRAADPPLSQAAFVIMALLFWFAFLGMMGLPLSKANSLVQSAVHSLVLAYAVPNLLVFTYVNTVLSLNIIGSILLYGLAGRKDQYYALYALVQGLPIALATWAEPLLCDRGLVHAGGHIIFDYTIPLVALVYAAIASNMTPRPVLQQGDAAAKKKN